MSKVCFITTVPFSAQHFLLPFIQALSKDHDVFLISNFSDIESSREVFFGVQLIHVPISREINIWSDLRGAYKLCRLMKEHQFSIIHSCTPKAGLLSTLAGRIARVPCRFHTFTGQVWATKRGFFRWLLKKMDKVIVNCATGILIDSPSQKRFLLREGVVSEKKSKVLGLGSICGVDTKRFKPDSMIRKQVRRQYSIPEGAFVFLFVGRLNCEKGVYELVEAFLRMISEYEDAWLLIAGPSEERVVENIMQRTHNVTNQIICDNYTETPEFLMAAADVFCLPSHREGFGSVIIESAAAGIPALGSNIYGISDAILDRETGLLHEVEDADSIYAVMKYFISDSDRTCEMGEKARVRAVNNFSREFLVEEFLRFYGEELPGFCARN